MSADAMSFNRRIVEEFRANEGRVGGEFEDAPLVLMTAIGAKSGQPRTTPHWYEDAGNGAVAIYASNNGHPEPPLWLANVSANPAVTVERGSNSYRAVARVTSGEERDRLWGAGGRGQPDVRRVPGEGRPSDRGGGARASRIRQLSLTMRRVAHCSDGLRRGNESLVSPALSRTRAERGAPPVSLFGPFQRPTDATAPAATGPSGRLSAEPLYCRRFLMARPGLEPGTHNFQACGPRLPEE